MFPGYACVRPDTSDTGKTALLPELATHPLYGGSIENSRLLLDKLGIIITQTEEADLNMIKNLRTCIERIARMKNCANNTIGCRGMDGKPDCGTPAREAEASGRIEVF